MPIYILSILLLRLTYFHRTFARSPRRQRDISASPADCANDAIGSYRIETVEELLTVLSRTVENAENKTNKKGNHERFSSQKL